MQMYQRIDSLPRRCNSEGPSTRKQMLFVIELLLIDIGPVHTYADIFENGETIFFYHFLQASEEHPVSYYQQR